MDYQLVILQGRSASQAIRLGDGITTVGRQDGCELKINSSQVSRKHCQIFEKKGLLLVKDLGSSNGTFVNGKRIEGQRVLEAGDEMAVGQVKFRIEKVTEAVPTAAKPSDTAVAQTPAAAPVEPGDVFEIDFEEAAADIALTDETDATQTQATPPAPPPEPKVEKPATAKAPPTQPKPEPEPEPQKELADEAVADFLTELKLDDDEDEES